MNSCRASDNLATVCSLIETVCLITVNNCDGRNVILSHHAVSIIN